MCARQKILRKNVRNSQNTLKPFFVLYMDNQWGLASPTRNPGKYI